METPIAEWQGQDLLLRLRVIPRSSADALVADAGGLKLRLTAPPVDGKANRALQRHLAEVFGVPKSQVDIVAGAAGRRKSVRIRAPRRLPDLLAELAACRPQAT